MTTWFFKLWAQLRFAPRTHSSARGYGVAAATRTRCGTGHTLEPAGKALSPPPGCSTTANAALPTKPLRIIQWVESASTQHPGNRRMVMSGRLADICAELDRLAALEGA